MGRITLLLAVLFWAKAVFAADGDLPRTLDELNHWYVEPPAGSNAATKFLEGTAALKITDADKASISLPLIGKGELPQADKPVPLEMKTAMADFIQRNQSAVRLFEQAAQLQQSRYPIDLSQGLMPLLPHLAKLRDAARVLEISAISHATAGQGKEAGNDLLISIAMARSLDSEPVLMSQLVRIALVKMTVSDLEQVLNRIVLPLQSLVQLNKSFGQSEQREAAGFGFTRALIRERVVDLRAFEMRPDQYLEISTNATVERREQLEAKIKRMMAEDRQYCKMTFNRALVLRNDPFPRRMVEEDELFSHAEAVATNKNYFLSAIFFEGLDKVAAKEATCLANLRLAQTAVSLARFRFDHTNHYPESLVELVPNYLKTLPVDPFDGQELRYRRMGNGYVLYSIGPNRKSNGNRGKEQQGGIVFTINSAPGHI